MFSYLLLDWKIHFAALLHFYTKFGHCKVPRSLLYQCEIAVDETGQVMLGKMNSLFADVVPKNDYKSSNDEDATSTGAEAVAGAVSDATNAEGICKVEEDYNSKSDEVSPRQPSQSTASQKPLIDSSEVGELSNVQSLSASTAVVDGAKPCKTISYASKLGRWLDDQRKARKGKRTKLLPVREALLQRLVDNGSLLWDATELKPNEINKKKGDMNWPRAFAALLKFGEIHGHYNVPKRSSFVCEVDDLPDETGSCVYEGKLGNWLYWQRELKKGRRGGLTEDRESKLQVLVDQGKLMWDVSELNPCMKSKRRGDDSWPRSFQALMNYGKEFGHCNVPDKKVYKTELPNGEVYEANLGNWVSWQRKLRKNKSDTGVSKLAPDREQLLQGLVDLGKFNW